MRTLTIPEFHAVLKAQGVTRREDFALKCPICQTVQSAQSLLNAGAGRTFEDLEKYIGFSCVGRFNGAGPFTKGKEPGKGCDWTLGGLFQLHELEIIDDDGQHHPRFAPASDIEAQALVHHLKDMRTAKP